MALVQQMIDKASKQFWVQLDGNFLFKFEQNGYSACHLSWSGICFSLCFTVPVVDSYGTFSCLVEFHRHNFLKIIWEIDQRSMDMSLV